MLISVCWKNYFVSSLYGLLFALNLFDFYYRMSSGLTFHTDIHQTFWNQDLYYYSFSFLLIYLIHLNCIQKYYFGILLDFILEMLGKLSERLFPLISFIYLALFAFWACLGLITRPTGGLNLPFKLWSNLLFVILE